jgi:hypothetical protein
MDELATRLSRQLKRRSGTARSLSAVAQASVGHLSGTPVRARRVVFRGVDDRIHLDQLRSAIGHRKGAAKLDL